MDEAVVPGPQAVRARGVAGPVRFRLPHCGEIAFQCASTARMFSGRQLRRVPSAVVQGVRDVDRLVSFQTHLLLGRPTVTSLNSPIAPFTQWRTRAEGYFRRRVRLARSRSSSGPQKELVAAAPLSSTTSTRLALGPAKGPVWLRWCWCHGVIIAVRRVKLLSMGNSFESYFASGRLALTRWS